MRVVLTTLVVWSAVLQAQAVKITPLGSHAGEFCSSDRAMLFEDPAGVRVLYDPGRTVAGGTDVRLGDVHVMLLSHAHVDHIGNVVPNPAAPGTCASPGTVPAAADSNFADIASAKNAAIYVGGELSTFLGRKIQNILGSATPACDAAGLGNEQVVPRGTPCATGLRPGGSVTVRLNGAAAGVKIAVVPAVHSNGIPAIFTDAPGVAPGTAAYGGSESGYIVKFTNGLTVYLTGDTGMFGDMKTIIHDYYQPNLMVINVGDIQTTGPDEAAFATTNLVKPQTVIPSHINEAATLSGQPAGPRMMRFLGQMNGSGINVVLPLSGVTLQFDGSGNCSSC
jgi:L-ascorbate metabolism protein UlaG (beta-lactamase superfamily)